MPGSIGYLDAARKVERDAVRYLGRFRRNPGYPVLEAAGKAQLVLQSALRRLDKLERGYEPEQVLRAKAASVVRRLGWRAVAKLLPGPAYQGLRIAVSLAKIPTSALGLGRGIGN